MPQRQLGRILFLAGAFVGFVLSVSLWFSDHHEEGIFVGIWVPSILALGCFWTLTTEGR
jgi:hypothetical protein